MAKKTKNPSVSFSQILAELVDYKKPFPAKYLKRFSDIPEDDLKSLKEIWASIQTERRVALLEDLEEIADTDTLVSFKDMAMFLLNDPEGRVRASAVRLLWEDDDRRLIPTYLKLMQNDPDEMVRATTASSLGIFVYLGEVEELPENFKERIEDALLIKLESNDTPLVRRRALESMGFSSRDAVPVLIKQAFTDSDRQWQASAVFAMGRSADSRWENAVMSVLNSEDPELQYEAVRAAGELEIEAARQPLLEMLNKPEDLDVEVKLAAIWSLSQIGGKGVKEILNNLLEKAEDDEEEEIIGNAIANLELIDGTSPIKLFDINIDNKDNLDEIMDLEDDLEDDEDDLDEDSFRTKGKLN